MNTGTRTLAALATALTVAAAGLIATAPAADAGTITYIEVGANQDPLADEVINSSFIFDQAPPAGTSVHVSVSSCGQFLTEKTQTGNGSDFKGVLLWFTATGEYDFKDRSVIPRIGPSFEWSLDITEPGLAPYTLTGSYSGYGVKRPSCAEILAGGGGSGSGDATKCVVKKVSKRIGEARVGATVRVTKPKTTSGCGRVSYRWAADGRTVKKAASLRIGSGLRGKRLTATVRVAKGGSTTLTFGKVR